MLDSHGHMHMVHSYKHTDIRSCSLLNGTGSNGCTIRSCSAFYSTCGILCDQDQSKKHTPPAMVAEGAARVLRVVSVMRGTWC